MRPKVYVETMIVSYLASRPSRDLIVAAHQQLTHEWWASRRQSFDLTTSQVVVDEASAGDREAAASRLEYLASVPLLEIGADVVELAERILERRAVPRKAAEDALHIAVATVHRVDYLLTWNCKHIANAEIQKAVGKICKELGFEAAGVCTPEELMGV